MDYAIDTKPKKIFAQQKVTKIFFYVSSKGL